MEATYVQRARERGQPDWSRIVVDTEPVREAARRVHTAGYGIDSETGEPDYLLPRELCPAHLVSMNIGSSPITYEDRVTQYRAVVDCFELSPEIVYHPGSGHDVSLSETFTESRVVYADVDEVAVTDLKRANYEAVGTDATEYELERGADTIVFRNAGLIEEAVVETNLRTGGWVLANDHLESARHLTQVESLELVGVVPDTWTGDSPAVDTTDMGAYLARLESDEEDSRRRRELAENSVYNGGRSRTNPATVDEEEREPLEENEDVLETGRTTGAPGSGVSTTKGTPLDLYVFRDDS